MGSVHKLMCIAVLACSLPLVHGTALGQAVPAHEDSAKVSSLLVEAKQDALRLQGDAHTMATRNRPQVVSLQGHANPLTKTQQDISDMGTVVMKLNQERAQASSWQKLAIDTVNPQLIELALNVEKRISSLKKSQISQPGQDQDDSKTSLGSTSNPAMVISDFIEYGKTKKQLDELTKNLAQLTKKLDITPGYGLE